MNVAVQLKFDLPYYYVAVQHVNHYVTGHPKIKMKKILVKI